VLSQEVTAVGMVLILVGLVAAGVVVDFAIENELTSAPRDTFALFGGSYGLSTPELVVAAAVLSALAVTLVILGFGLFRGSWGRRRALNRRIQDLERENARLRSKERLAAAVGEPSRPRPTSDSDEWR
jgi:uncharacterized membrane protein